MRQIVASFVRVPMSGCSKRRVIIRLKAAFDVSRAVRRLAIDVIEDRAKIGPKQGRHQTSSSRGIIAEL